MPETATMENLKTTLGNFRDSLTALAETAGVEETPVSPSIDAEQLDTPRNRRPEQPQFSSTESIINEISNVPSAVADDTAISGEEDELRALIRQQAGEAETRADLEERFDVSGIEREIADISADISRRRASLTKGLVDQEGRPIAQEFITGRKAQMRRQAAAEVEGLQAAQEAALGNLASAQSAIERAVRAKYDPVRENIQIQQQLLEVRKNAMTRKEKKLAEKRQTELNVLQMQYDRQREAESTTLNQITSAVQNGFSPRRAAALSTQVVSGEIQPSQVIGEIGGYLGLLERQAANRAAANAALTRRNQLFSLAQQGDQMAIQELGFDPNNQPMSVEQIEQNELAYAENVENISRVQNLLDNTVGINTTSGLVRNAWLSGLFTGGQAEGVGTLTRFTPIVGNVQGAVQAANDKQRFLTDIRYIVNNLTLDKFLEAKEKGATFGALSEEEWRIIGAAANELSASTIKDKSGSIVGFDTTEEKMVEELTAIQDAYRQAIDKLNTEAGLNNSERSEIRATYYGTE